MFYNKVPESWFCSESEWSSFVKLALRLSGVACPFPGDEIAANTVTLPESTLVSDGGPGRIQPSCRRNSRLKLSLQNE